MSTTAVAAAAFQTGEGGEGGETEEVATEFAHCSLRRGRSITDLQYSRRSLLHGGSFATVALYVCVFARARARVCVCVCLLLGRRHAANGEWKRFVAEGGRDAVARWRGRGESGLREGAVGGRAAQGGTESDRDPQVVLNPLPTSLHVAFESQESPVRGLPSLSNPFFCATEFAVLFYPRRYFIPGSHKKKKKRKKRVAVTMQAQCDP